MKIILLEDNQEYMVAKEINNYLLLINTKDMANFCIRKVIKKDNKEILTTLANDEEYEYALRLMQ